MDICEFAKRYDTGFVVFKSAPGQAKAFAQAVSKEWQYPPLSDVYLVVGVRWAAAMKDGETVIVAVRCKRDGLAEWVKGTKEQYGKKYGVDEDKHTVDTGYKDGKVAAAGHDGLP